MSTRQPFQIPATPTPNPPRRLNVLHTRIRRIGNGLILAGLISGFAYLWIEFLIHLFVIKPAGANVGDQFDYLDYIDTIERWTLIVGPLGWFAMATPIIGVILHLVVSRRRELQMQSRELRETDDTPMP